MCSTNPIICVSGADGSGKSTLVAALARAIPNARAVSIWDLMADPNGAALFPNKATLQTFLGSMKPESRSLFITSCLLEAMQRAPTGVRIVDSYWYKFMASELLLGAQHPVAAALSRMFVPPTLTFRLSVSPWVAAERKQGRYTPYECGLRAPTLENFVDFQTRSAPLVRGLIDGDAHPVVDLDATLPPSSLFEQALARLQPVLA